MHSLYSPFSASCNKDAQLKPKQLFTTFMPLSDGAVAGSHNREVSLVLENSTTVPLHHRLTLQYLLTHLAKVTQAQASNGLDTNTLGKIFGPLLIWTGPTTAW